MKQGKFATFRNQPSTAALSLPKRKPGVEPAANPQRFPIARGTNPTRYSWAPRVDAGRGGPARGPCSARHRYPPWARSGVAGVGREADLFLAAGCALVTLLGLCQPRRLGLSLLPRASEAAIVDTGISRAPPIA
jgi:hypothetical protein